MISATPPECYRKNEVWCPSADQPLPCQMQANLRNHRSFLKARISFFFRNTVKFLFVELGITLGVNSAVYSSTGATYTCVAVFNYIFDIVGAETPHKPTTPSLLCEGSIAHSQHTKTLLPKRCAALTYRVSLPTRESKPLSQVRPSRAQ